MAAAQLTRPYAAAQPARPTAAPSGPHTPQTAPTIPRPTVATPAAGVPVAPTGAPPPEPEPIAVSPAVEVGQRDFQDVVARLGISPPLNNVQMQALAAALRRLSVASGRRIVEQGQRADTAFMLVLGWAHIEYAAQGRGPQQIGAAMPGDVVGEEVILGGQFQSYSVTAATDSVVFALPARQFAQLQLGDAMLGMRLRTAVIAQQRRRQLERGI